MKIARLDLFKRRVLFFNNRKEMDKYHNFKFSEDINNDNCHGICITDKDYCIAVFNKSSAVLVHEINHVCFFICDDLGIEIGKADRETFCYMSEYLFNKFNKHI